MEIYRDPRNARLGGVCAGVALYLGIETWIIRLLTVTAFLFSGGVLVVILYIVAYLFLDPLPYADVQWSEYKAKRKPWMKGTTPNESLDRVESVLQRNEEKIRRLEAYVTSSTFKTDRDFSNL